jgi:hypothetical protein
MKRARSGRLWASVVLVVAALLSASMLAPAFGAPKAVSAASLASKVAQALKLSKAANRNAKRALARSGQSGPTGPAGAKGDSGAAGAKGETGAAGPQGTQGDLGPQGNPGAQGIPGPQGNTGPQGAQGAQGPAGTARAYALVRMSGGTPGLSIAYNFTSVGRSSTGVYCLEMAGAAGNVNNYPAAVTVDWLGTTGPEGNTDAMYRGVCGSNGIQVFTTRWNAAGNSGAANDVAFTVVVP